MSKHTNLFVQVGRAEPRPLCSADQESPIHDILLSATESEAMRNLIASGIDPTRIKFSRESVDTDELEASAGTKTVKPKKGK